MNIALVLHQRAVECPDAPALIDVHRGGDRSLTFEQFEKSAARAAAELARQGVRRGDGILVLHPMSAELYIFLMALFRIGAVAVFPDPSAGRQHIARCCELFPLRGFFGSRKAHLLRIIVPALNRLPGAWCSQVFPGARVLPLDEREGPEAPISDLAPSAPALVTFTSGSTGQPRAALRSHAFLLAQHRALAAGIGLRAGVVDLTTLPVFVLANLASGVTSVLPEADLRKPGKIEAIPVLQQIGRHRIETIGASPALIACLADAVERGGTPLRGVRHVFMGGAPVFPRDLRRASAAFPQAEITAVYGSTEAEPIAEVSLSAISPDDFRVMERGGGLLAGVPLTSLSLRIIRDQWGKPLGALDANTFEKLSLPAGDTGEIVVSGDHVLPGYLHGVGDAETKFDVDEARWHRTGDLGRFDQKGRLWLLGRASAKIQDQRGLLYPFAVECAAQQVPGVRHAALVALGGKRVLVYEGAGAKTPEAITAALAWAQIDEARELRSIPMDKRHNAKVDYVALARELRSR